MSDGCSETFFDAHCHIDPIHHCDKIGDINSAAGRLLCGVSPEDWTVVTAVAPHWPGTVAALGLHPWHAADAEWNDDVFDRLDGMLSDNPGCWVGEIGLDGLRTGGEKQEKAFSAQLRLAIRHQRRVNLHCVKAWDALEEMLAREYLSRGGREGFIIHSFAGPHQSLRRLAGMGAFFTVGPLAWRRASRKQEERVRLLPLDRVLLESDAFLVPGVDALDDLRKTLTWLADVRGMAAGDLVTAIDANVRRLTADE